MIGPLQVMWLYLPCEVYIFIFDNAWACSVGVVVECKAGMLVVASSIVGQLKIFFYLKWLKTFLRIQKS